MVRFLVRAVVAALGLALAAYMLAGVSYDGFVDLLIAAVVLNLLLATVAAPRAGSARRRASLVPGLPDALGFE